ncbi:MAG: DUF3592 domain-containing protein [Pseudomonadota bacterium]
MGIRTMLLPWFAYALPAVSVVLGGIFAVKSFSFLREAHACAQWPTAPGWVVRAQVKRQAADDGDRYSDLQVLYTYRVNDREYRGTRLYAGGAPQSRVAEALVEKYRTGADIAVHYNPADPAVAILEPTSFASARFTNLAAVVFGGAGLAMLATLSLVQ